LGTVAARLIVLDTHAWLWWVDAPERLSKRATRAIGAADAIGVCTASVFELVVLAERRRIRIDSPIREWISNALGREPIEPLVLTARIAVEAAQLRFTGDPFDRIIYATARSEDAQLVTRDARMHEFDSGRAVW
jgi:PIN domain nuclease of toxin-antitoxin system